MARHRSISYALDIGRANGWGRAVRFIAHTLIHRGSTERWLECLDETLLQSVPADIRLHLAQKVLRPCVRPWTDAAERTVLLTAHYSGLVRALPRSAFETHLQPSGLPITTLVGKSGTHYALVMGFARSKEGDLSLSLNDAESGVTFATLVGLLGRRAGKPVFWIGGLQGPKRPFGRADIVRVTRDLHGLRPKHAVLRAAMAVANALGAAEIVAPSRSNHVSRRRWMLWRFRRDIKSDYDAFWAEFSSESLADGDFIIPLTPAVRSAAGLRSKKRKDWAMRQRYLAALSDGVVACFGAHGSGSLDEDDAAPHRRAAM